MLTVAEMEAEVERMLRKACEDAGGEYAEFITDLERAFDARFEIIQEDD